MKAKSDIKEIKAVEVQLKEVDEAIVNGSVDIKEIRESIAKLSSEARDIRLAREKEVKSRDAELKDEIVNKALSLIDHPNKGNYEVEVRDAMKGKKILSIMAKEANLCAEEINRDILDSREVIDAYIKDHNSSLFPDRLDLEMKLIDYLIPELNRRVEAHKHEQEVKALKEQAEAAEKKAKEAEAAQAAQATLEPAQEPAQEYTPPKIDSIPVKNTADPQTHEEEKAEFCKLVTTAFAPIKAAREALKHDTNIAKAERFAQTLGKAWKEFTA